MLNGKLVLTSSSYAIRAHRTQAHRIVTQVVIIGARVFGRAFAEAYKQASVASKYQKTAGKAAGASFASAGLTLDEACKILNVQPPAGGKANMESVMERFKTLFDKNDPNNGGSFYLQSKICLLYTSPSPRDRTRSRMPSSA